MDFVSATRKALADNKWMRNGNWSCAKQLAVKPTVLTDGIIITAEGNNQIISPRWQPQADDILSDQWEVINIPDWITDEALDLLTKKYA